jgi:ribose/xylose/arabinose/galactoside ABC-type transport system permease subunit
MLLTHVAGRLNLALGAGYAALTTGFAASSHATDTYIVAVAALGVVGVVLCGALLQRFRLFAVVGLVLYFVISQIAGLFGGGSNRSVVVEQSHILRFVGSRTFGMPNDLLLLALVVAGTSLLLFRTGAGLRIRAGGFDPTGLRYLAGPTRSAVTVAQVAAGCTLALGAAVVFSRGSTNVSATAVDDLLYSVAAVVIGSGGIERSAPSPVRVAAAAIVLQYLTMEVNAASFAGATADVVTGAIVLVVLGLDTGSWTGIRQAIRGRLVERSPVHDHPSDATARGRPANLPTPADT